MGPERSSAGWPRRVALFLVATAVCLVAAGAVWFGRFASQARRDPGLVYRDPGTLERLLKRGNDAERAGDWATAITTYRFVEAVGKGGGAQVAAYVTAARAGLKRLGASDTVPDPSR